MFKIFDKITPKFVKSDGEVSWGSYIQDNKLQQTYLMNSDEITTNILYRLILISNQYTKSMSSNLYDKNNSQDNRGRLERVRDRERKVTCLRLKKPS